MNWDAIIDKGVSGLVGMFILLAGIYGTFWIIKTVLRTLRALRDNREELARKAGAAIGAATEITKSTADAFVDGYKNKR